MDAEKRKRYENIAAEIVRLVGGRDNILGVAHCATRLRLVLEDNDKADTKAIEDVDLVKGVFVAGDQLQIIFGAGLVNDVCQVLADSIHMDSMSLGDLKTKANKRMNPLQRAVKALSDVFIEIMPGILAAALLTGLSSVLGNIEFVQNNDTLYGLSRLINISSGAIFGFLPLCVAYSTVKRFGGRPIMGIVIGCIMLTNSLADASAAAQGTVDVTTLHIFGLPVELIGFQGGIIVALLIGIVTAKLDIFFERKVPEVIRLLVSPLLTTLVSSFLLFMIIGPVRELENLNWKREVPENGRYRWADKTLKAVFSQIRGEKRQICIGTEKNHLKVTVQGDQVELSFLDEKGTPAVCGGGRGKRTGRVENKIEDLLILIDSSIIEIFVNQGELVFTTRIYLEKEEREIRAGKWENAFLEVVEE